MALYFPSRNVPSSPLVSQDYRTTPCRFISVLISMKQVGNLATSVVAIAGQARDGLVDTYWRALARALLVLRETRKATRLPTMINPANAYSAASVEPVWSLMKPTR